MSEKAGIITQVRMTSTRLPGKVLQKAGGISLLQHHVNRLKWSGLPIIIATTTNKEDDPVCEFAKEQNLPYFRGSEHDVLSRFYYAAEENKLDTVVRVTSDCPLIDGSIIKWAVESHLAKNDENLYTANVLDRTYPRGLDFEVFSFSRLKTAFENAKEDFQREHVTPFLNRNADGKTKISHIKSAFDLSDWRITVDTPDDLKLIKTLIEQLEMQTMTYNERIGV